MSVEQATEADYVKSGHSGLDWLYAEKLDRWLELLCVALLAIASLLTAWSGYQATLWSGEQSILFSQASTKRVESTRANANGNVFEVRDANLFSEWADAYVSGDQQLMDFYRNRFSPEFETAMVAWIATDPLNDPGAPSAPYVMPEYVNPEMERSEQLDAEAEALFAEGQVANDRADRYVLATVLSATVLFFAGLATKIAWLPARLLTIALATGLTLYVLARTLTYPLA